MKYPLLKDIGLLVFRVSISVMMMMHGVPKFLKLMSGDVGFGDPIGIGAVPSLILTIIGELLCPLFIIVGFKTRIAAIPAVITMAVATFIVHLSAPFETKEKALFYFVGFLTILLTGPGKFSIDKR